MENFSLTVDSLKLQGKLFNKMSNAKKPAVLFIHGWESKQDRNFQFAEELASLGYFCITFDLRGHGLSEGDHKLFSRQEFLTDVVAAYDFLVSQEEVDANKVTVIGSSFGSYLAALLSEKREVHALVLRVPADYRDEGFNESLYEQRQAPGRILWKEQLHSKDETAALRATHKFKGKLLIVESEKDEIVPATTVLSYKNAAHDSVKLKYIVMSGAPHSISHHPELQREFADIVLDWLK